MKAIGQGTVDSAKLAGTILDAKLAGKTLCLNLERHLGAVLADEDTRIRKCRLDYRLRQGLKRDHAGKLVLSPVLRAADRLIAAMVDGAPTKVHRAALGFFNSRCEEMAKEFDKIARIRTANSAFLVGVGSYNEDIFVGDNYIHGRIGFLQPWEIGLGSRILEKLDVEEHDVVLISRYPTTRVVPVEVREIREASDVVCLPVGTVRVYGDMTSVSNLLDGDRDGDSYVVRTVRSTRAKTELSQAFEAFWNGAREQPLDRTTFTWRDHEERIEDPEGIAREKFMQKAAVGPITLDWYCAFIHLLHLRSKGIETELSMEDLRQLMTSALESCFDLKHSNNADPMALHSLMTGVKTYPQVEESLMTQGFDMDQIRKLARLLGGQSVRKLAQENLPFAITQEHLDFNAVQKFVNSSAPPYKPLEFVTALMVASQLRTPLSRDLVLFALRNARTLAEVYRDGLFPTLAN